MRRSLSVRAIDVGYGHIKFTTGRDPETGLITTESFPSQSPVVDVSSLSETTEAKHDHFIVPIEDRYYAVGKDVGFAMKGANISEVLDNEFVTTPAYAARLFGAINYMYRDLPDDTIDYLILGLPMTTIRDHRQTLKNLFTGTKLINNHGDKVKINHIEVFPQPLGSYSAFMTANPPSQGKKLPMALVVDPGYNTVDWFVVQGMKANEVQCGAVNRGMSAVLEGIARRMATPVEQGGSQFSKGASIPALIRRIDQSLTSGEPFSMMGHEIPLDKFMDAGNAIIDEAAQAIKNSLGIAMEIDVIILTGGGSRFYEPAIRAAFPLHKVVLLDDPAHANVRGFHFMGERIARSAERAGHSSATVAA